MTLVSLLAHNPPYEVTAMRAIRRLPQKRRHELVTVHDVDLSPHCSLSLLHQPQLTLLEHLLRTLYRIETVRHQTTPHRRKAGLRIGVSLKAAER